MSVTIQHESLPWVNNAFANSFDAANYVPASSMAMASTPTSRFLKTFQGALVSAEPYMRLLL
jgi:hypothetical protein